MSKICEHHSDVFTSDQHTLVNIIPVFMNSVRDKPRISNQICRAIGNLCVSTQVDQGNVMSPYFTNLFKLLIDNAYRTDYDGTSADLALASFTALNALCEAAGEEVNDNLYSMLIPVLQLLENTLNSDLQTYGDKKAREY